MRCPRAGEHLRVARRNTRSGETVRDELAATRDMSGLQIACPDRVRGAGEITAVQPVRLDQPIYYRAQEGAVAARRLDRAELKQIAVGCVAREVED